MKRITLDIDYKTPHKPSLPINQILTKIINCNLCYSLTSELSPSMNGYHITVWCQAKNCTMCRLAFDDQKRFRNDSNLRQPHQQNILFNTYTINGNHKPITL